MNDTIGEHTDAEALCESSKTVQPKQEENQEGRQVFITYNQAEMKSLKLAVSLHKSEYLWIP